MRMGSWFHSVGCQKSLGCLPFKALSAKSFSKLGQEPKRGHRNENFKSICWQAKSKRIQNRMQSHSPMPMTPPVVANLVMLPFACLTMSPSRKMGHSLQNREKYFIQTCLNSLEFDAKTDSQLFMLWHWQTIRFSRSSTSTYAGPLIGLSNCKRKARANGGRLHSIMFSISVQQCLRKRASASGNILWWVTRMGLSTKSFLNSMDEQPFELLLQDKMVISFRTFVREQARPSTYDVCLDFASPNRFLAYKCGIEQKATSLCTLHLARVFPLPCSRQVTHV